MGYFMEYMEDHLINRVMLKKPPILTSLMGEIPMVLDLKSDAYYNVMPPATIAKLVQKNNNYGLWYL
jgi:hypothetical protein